MAHGDAREGKWRGHWRMEWVASTLTLRRNAVYPALLPLMRKPRLPVVEWTDAPADLNGLARFAERPNLVSARVPSHFKRSLPAMPVTSCERKQWTRQTMYAERNTEARYSNHCCSGKPTSIKHNLSVCICSRRYPACNAPAPLCNIFPHYPINGTIFGGEKKLSNTKCFDFLYNFCLKHFSC
jgi:hypothetical protein